MNNDDMIEKLAFELFEKSHEPSFSDDAQGLEEARAWARKIATDLLPTREEIADVILAESLFGSRTPIAIADAVLALLKGQDNLNPSNSMGIEHEENNDD